MNPYGLQTVWHTSLQTFSLILLGSLIVTTVITGFSCRISVVSSLTYALIFVFGTGGYIATHFVDFGWNTFILQGPTALGVFSLLMLPTIWSYFLAILIGCKHALVLDEGKGREGNWEYDFFSLFLTGLWAAIITFSLTQWFQVGPVGVFLSLLALLGIRPIVQHFSVAKTVEIVHATEMKPSIERQQILDMISSGKITAQEGTNLLSAIGEVRWPVAGGAWKKSNGRAFFILGAVLVMVGFLMPWFKIDPSRELNKMSNQMASLMANHAALGSQHFGMAMNGSNDPFSQATQALSGISSISVNGGQIGSGIGWLILACGIFAAALPMLIVGMEPKQRIAIQKCSLLVGGFLIIYVALSALDSIAIGLLIVAAGFGLQIAGVVRDSQGMGGSEASGLNAE